MDSEASSPDKPPHPRAERFRTILRDRYGDDQSRMAKETGLSQSHISLIQSGQRTPGPKVLASLEKIPGFNPVWFQTGVGPPFLPEHRKKPTNLLSLPVYKKLLEVTFDDLGRKSGMKLHIRSLFRPKMYLLEIQAYDPIVKASQCLIAAGDLLVMETNRTSWQKNPQLLVGKYAVVRLRGRWGARYDLAQVEDLPALGQLVVQVFGVGTVPLAPLLDEPGDGHESDIDVMRTDKVPQRAMLQSDQHRAQDALAEARVTLSDLIQRGVLLKAPTTDDIVAVSTLLIRR